MKKSFLFLLLRHAGGGGGWHKVGGGGPCAHGVGPLTHCRCPGQIIIEKKNPRPQPLFKQNGNELDITL